MNMLRIGLAQCEQVDGLDRNAQIIFRFLTRAGGVVTRAEDGPNEAPRVRLFERLTDAQGNVPAEKNAVAGGETIVLDWQLLASPPATP